MAAALGRPRDADDAGPGAVLRRHGAGQERALDVHAQLLRARPRHRAVRDRRLQPVLRDELARRDRRLRLLRARRCRHRGAPRRDHAAPRVHDLPVHVRGDRARADLRRLRRAPQVLRLRRVHARLDDADLRSDRALVVGDRRLAPRARRDRLRGRHRRPPVLRHLGARVRARPRQAQGLPGGAPPAA